MSRIAAVTRIPPALSSGLSMISIGTPLSSFRRPASSIPEIDLLRQRDFCGSKIVRDQPFREPSGTARSNSDAENSLGQCPADRRCAWIGPLQPPFDQTSLLSRNFSSSTVPTLPVGAHRHGPLLHCRRPFQRLEQVLSPDPHQGHHGNGRRSRRRSRSRLRPAPRRSRTPATSHGRSPSTRAA